MAHTHRVRMASLLVLLFQPGCVRILSAKDLSNHFWLTHRDRRTDATLCRRAIFSSLPVATIGPLWTLGSCDQSRTVYAVPFLAAAKLSDDIFRYLPHGVVNLVEKKLSSRHVDPYVSQSHKWTPDLLSYRQ